MSELIEELLDYIEAAILAAERKRESGCSHTWRHQQALDIKEKVRDKAAEMSQRGI